MKNNTILINDTLFVRAQVVKLPTEKNSKNRLWTHPDGSLHYNKFPYGRIDKAYHLYIVTEEKIKEDDWYIDDTDQVRQAITSDPDYWERRPDYKKIIASTDSKLGSWKEIEGDRNNRKVFFKLNQPSKPFIENYCKQGGNDNILVECESIKNNEDEIIIIN